MTQLLISVKNVEEALIALDAGADIIDLKDPNIGALGALDAVLSLQIVQVINGRAIISATIGEQHASLNALIASIEARAKLGVDIIKIAVPKFFNDPEFLLEITQLTNNGIKIVAVLFADEPIELSLLDKCQQMGFFGAMLDTHNKQQNLLQVQTQSYLQTFTQKCNLHQLKCGFAGSLRPQDIESLINFNPTYIGFRGGVCENGMRISTLLHCKVLEVKNMLHKSNKINQKAQKSRGLALHS